MKTARRIFWIVGMLIFLGGVFWHQIGELYFLNIIAMTVGATMLFCGTWVFRNPEIRPEE